MVIDVAKLIREKWGWHQWGAIIVVAREVGAEIEILKFYNKKMNKIFSWLISQVLWLSHYSNNKNIKIMVLKLKNSDNKAKENSDNKVEKILAIKL